MLIYNKIIAMLFSEKISECVKNTNLQGECLILVMYSILFNVILMEYF